MKVIRNSLQPLHRADINRMNLPSRVSIQQKHVSNSSSSTLSSLQALLPNLNMLSDDDDDALTDEDLPQRPKSKPPIIYQPPKPLPKHYQNLLHRL